MGEIVFSLFIGGCIAAVGLYLNWDLYREQKRHGIEDEKM
ncbi:hypothetical protein GGQ74_000047 [Desulfobaculum xiamenense]|uniref:Uncharacterized protein n=1 Tax=Desulfobaculum xiamenense TaxID=995050 RepID=A0A846QHC7_9BACT|nr:hypothetical protein [Desulfobaculum xiamenense]